MDTTKLNLLLEAIDEINILEDEIAMLEESAGRNNARAILNESIEYAICFLIYWMKINKKKINNREIGKIPISHLIFRIFLK